jgi:hypothetical protein
MLNKNNKVQNSNTTFKNEFYKNGSFVSEASNDLPCYINDYFRTTSAQSSELKTPDLKQNIQTIE